MPENALSSLYPQPPAQAQNLMNDPSKVAGIIGQMNQNKLFDATFEAQSQTPAANLQTIRQMQQFEARQRVGTALSNAISGLGPHATEDDVRSVTTHIARSFPDIANTYPEMIPAAKDLILNSKKGDLQHGANILRNSVLSAGEGAGRTDTTDPNSGTKYSVPNTTANMGGAIQTSLAPGESALAESATGRAAKLQSSASTSPQYHADLENLKADSKILDNLGGPSFEVEKKLNQLTSRLGGFGITMTPEQLKAGESFDKIANQISLNQSQSFHGSDAGLHTVVGANPSTSMSKFGREGVIDMLHGNQDAIDVSRKAWLKARANGAKPGDYDLFAERMGQEVDPRVFQFNRLSRENQQKFLSQMDPSDLKDFEEKFSNSVKNKWVKPLKSADGK